jgi:hypothetical protein
MEQNQRRWYLAMGIVVTSLAGLGILGALMEYTMVPMFNMQKEMMESIHEQQMARNPNVNQAEVEMMRKMFNIPDWFGIFIPLTTTISLVMKGFYLYSGITMIQKKYTSKWWYTVSAIALTALNIIRFAAVLSTGSMMLIGMAIGYLWNVILEISILVLILKNLRPVQDVPGEA